jgi:hypothetical protein
MYSVVYTIRSISTLYSKYSWHVPEASRANFCSLLPPTSPHHIDPTPISTIVQRDMSFFGFDSNLPRDRQPGPSATRGFFENPDPFAEVARARALEDDDA